MATGDEVGLGVFPRDLVIDQNGALSMTVAEVEQLETESYVFGNWGNGQTVTVHQAGQTDTRIGDIIRLSFARFATYLFRKDNGLACY